MCALVCALCLYPATPGWVVRCGCVCSGSGFGCAPPILAGVSGFLSACVHNPLEPRQSWLWCTVWLCVLRLGFGCAPPLLAGVLGCVCACVRALLVARHSWLRCAVCVCVLGLGFWLRLPSLAWGVGVCVFVCSLRLYAATPGWGLSRWGVCLGLGFGCAPPLLAGVLGCMCVPVRAPLVPRLSWLGCAVWVGALGLWPQLHPATPGWGVGVCVCALCSYPATPGCSVRCGLVCLGSGFGCALPLLAGLLGCVCVRLRAPPVPRHSWLGCAWVCFGSGFVCAPPLVAWVCVGVLRLRFCLRPASRGLGAGVCVFVCSLRLSPATPGWSVGVCVCALRLYPATPGCGVRCESVCLGSGFGCAPPLPAGPLGCVCGPVRASLVPRHSWLGFAVWVGVLGLRFWLRAATPGWGVEVCVCALRLYPATPGCGVLCGCLCFGSGFGCAPPLLFGVFGVCLRLRARSSCTLPPLAGVCGVGPCAWAPVSSAPRHSWLGSWGVCALVCALCLYPATPCWGVLCGCVCLGSGFGCAPPLLAGVLGCVCVCVCAPLVPCHSWLGCVVWVCVLVCALRLYPATPGLGLWCVGLVLPGTCSCAGWRHAGSVALPRAASGGCRVVLPTSPPLGCFVRGFFFCACRVFAGCPRPPAGFGAWLPLGGLVGRGCLCVLQNRLYASRTSPSVGWGCPVCVVALRM